MGMKSWLLMPFHDYGIAGMPRRIEMAYGRDGLKF
jgi:hypothetical protein